MSDEFANLTVPEIQALIDRASAEIERRKEAGRATLKAEIAEKLRDAGLAFADLFPEIGKGEKAKSKSDAPKRAVAPKFKNHVSGETWSGRGARPPMWVNMILSERGWTIDQFKASEEFLAQN
ncbi:H-NS histone family protein [Methylocystis sp. IM3]|uniref:H-NS histone family protein n=1 Tax=unclassified Methylocystis TaxID=2625913 RepID=UPI0030F54F18